MRTTLTIETDVERMLRDRMRRTGRNLKATVNQALRRGLLEFDAPRAEAPFKVDPSRMGIRAGIDPGRLNQLSDELEVDAFLRTAERLRSKRTADA